jgi:hypothetical protein
MPSSMSRIETPSTGNGIANEMPMPAMPPTASGWLHGLAEFAVINEVRGDSGDRQRQQKPMPEGSPTRTHRRHLFGGSDG